MRIRCKIMSSNNTPMSEMVLHTNPRTFCGISKTDRKLLVNLLERLEILHKNLTDPQRKIVRKINRWIRNGRKPPSFKQFRTIQEIAEQHNLGQIMYGQFYVNE